MCCSFTFSYFQALEGTPGKIFITPCQSLVSTISSKLPSLFHQKVELEMKICPPSVPLATGVSVDSRPSQLTQKKKCTCVYKPAYINICVNISTFFHIYLHKVKHEFLLLSPVPHDFILQYMSLSTHHHYLHVISYSRESWPPLCNNRVP